MISIHDNFILIYSGDPVPLVTSDGQWETARSGSNAHYQAIAAESGHSGILQLKTSNSTGSYLRLFKAHDGWQSGTSPNTVWFDDVSSFEWEARIPDLTSVAFTLSLADTITLNRAAAFTFDTNVDGNLRCVTSGASGPQTTSITAPSTSNFHVFRVEVQVGQVDFSIDGSLVASHTDTTKLPFGVAVTPYAALFARASAYKYLDLDRFDLA